MSTLNASLPLPADNRYARQILLPEIGEEGQARLSRAAVLLIGIGGLGGPTALSLTGAGIGRIGLMDDDRISLTNLHRQILYSEREVGELKAQCAARRLGALNSEVSFDVYTHRLTAENAQSLFARYDLIIDGTDNFQTRYVIDEACSALGKPYVYGAICGFEGQVAVFHTSGHPFRYTDLYPDKEGILQMPPPSKAVLPTTPAVVGNVMATQALQILSGHQASLAGKLWTVDLQTMETNLMSF